MTTLGKLASVLLVLVTACAVEGTEDPAGDEGDDGATVDPGTPGMPGAPATPDAGTPPAPALPQTCADIAAAQPGAHDATFTLYVGGDAAKPWLAYCADLATAPAEYLPLVNTFFGANMATFPTTVGNGGSSVGTSYTKLRIDPISLEVDIDDMRFAESQGSHAVPGTTEIATSVSFGVAINCNDWFDAGAAIDLGGTPFRYDGAFSSGSQVTADAAHQVFKITATGNCGANGPGTLPAMPMNGRTGQVMQLTYAK